MLYYLSQQLLNWAKGTPMADELSWLRLFRYITVRSAGAAVTALRLELVARPDDHPLAERSEIRPGIRGQSRGSRRSGGARVEQKRHADHGRAFDRGGAADFDDAVGAMERAGGIDDALGAGAGGTGILRRLRENFEAERRRHAAAGEIDRAICAGGVRRDLSVGIAGEERVAFARRQERLALQSGFEPDAAVLQISASCRRGGRRVRS